MSQTNLGNILIAQSLTRFEYLPVVLNRDIIYNCELLVTGDTSIQGFSRFDIGYTTIFRGTGVSSTPPLVSIEEINQPFHLLLSFEGDVRANPEIVFWCREVPINGKPSGTPVARCRIQIDDDSVFQSRVEQIRQSL